MKFVEFVAQVKHVGDDVRERWETSDSALVHRILVGREKHVVGARVGVQWGGSAGWVAGDMLCVCSKTLYVLAVGVVMGGGGGSGVRGYADSVGMFRR